MSSWCIVRPLLQGVPFLRQLSLSNNNIRLVQPLSFSRLVNLHMLDLSRNKIQVVRCCLPPHLII